MGRVSIFDSLSKKRELLLKAFAEKLHEVRPGFASTAFNADKAKAVPIPKAEVNLDETLFSIPRSKV